MTAIRPRTILIAGWLVFVLYAYPGYMSSDSVDQLFDAKVGTFNDWHSPVMTEVWRLVSYAVTGPFGMLALQSWLLLGGTYALLARITRPRAAALGAAALLVFPPVMATMAVIWPDSQLVGFLMAGFAGITSPRRGARIAGAGLLVLAAAMRPTAVLAALPLIVAALAARAARAGWRPLAVRWRRALASLAAVAAIWLGALGLDACVRSASTEHVRLDRAIADIVGVTHDAPAFDDTSARAVLDGIPTYAGALRDRIAGAYGHTERLTSGPSRVFEMPRTAEQRALVFAAASRLIRSYPAAYFKYRWRGFSRVLGLKRTKERQVYTGFAGSEAQGDQVQHTAMHSAVQSAAIVVVKLVANGRINRPYVYLLLAILALPLAWRRRHGQAAVLLASGLIYELSLFFVATTSSYALSSWLITTTSLAVGLIVRGELARRRDHGNSSNSAS